MARPNSFKFKSFFKEVDKELRREEKRALTKAARVFTGELKKTIKSKGLVDEGNLLKGVSSTIYQHTAIVGIAWPGMHAMLVEFGTLERFKKNGASSGVMPANPYFMPTYRMAEPAIIKTMREEW